MTRGASVMPDTIRGRRRGLAAALGQRLVLIAADHDAPLADRLRGGVLAVEPGHQIRAVVRRGAHVALLFAQVGTVVAALQMAAVAAPVDAAVAHARHDTGGS